MGKYKTIKEKATVTSAIDYFFSEVESLRDEVDEWRGEMEGTPLENTSKYQTLEEAVSNLEDASGRRPDSPEGIEDKEIEVTVWVPKSKRQSSSRATRLSNATSYANAAIDEIRSQIEVLKEDTEEELAKKEELESFISEFEGAIETAESTEFPGMY